MINDRAKPIFTYSTHRAYKGMNLEIKGELYDTPYKKSESFECYSKVTIIDQATEHSAIVLQMGDIPQNDLITETDYVKNNIEKYVP